MSWRLRRRLIWLAAFSSMAAAAGDLSVDGPALASPPHARAEPACVPNLFHPCPRYDDAAPR